MKLKNKNNQEELILEKKRVIEITIEATNNKSGKVKRKSCEHKLKVLYQNQSLQVIKKRKEVRKEKILMTLK